MIKYIYRFSSLIALTTVLVSPMLMAQPSKAQAVKFTLINATNRVLEEFYASPPQVDDWEEDILGVDVLNPGESVVITIEDGRSDCYYDFKGVLGPGKGVGRGELIESKVSVCDGGTYTYRQK
jgi:hypothetical protein